MFSPKTIEKRSGLCLGDFYVSIFPSYCFKLSIPIFEEVSSIRFHFGGVDNEACSCVFDYFSASLPSMVGSFVSDTEIISERFGFLSAFDAFTLPSSFGEFFFGYSEPFSNVILHNITHNKKRGS